MKYLKETPWDNRNFNIATFEVMSPEIEALQETDKYEGHYTIKVDPNESNQKLVEYDFYYADTLIEPVCKKDELNVFENEHLSISKTYDSQAVNQIAENVFTNSRFHRDFNIASFLADLRYKNWVKDLQKKDQVYGLYYKDELAGFYAYEKNQVLLLGIDEKHQGKGLTKAFTSNGCKAQFEQGYDELRTSISAANIASLNLFLALGFKLEKTVDVYHKLHGPSVTGV
ncbi:GNAT family N-acetyltransferase [Virgibacillus sp. W0181]|uniref:GNAT family N-acetyltransferase n=1 Tax=Virgibacillus sp. W0181 TaxID=3391581 RepID=UPI003F48259E